ncbi:MAG: ABC transporter permease [Promethearchaeota archaeon]
MNIQKIRFKWIIGPIVLLIIWNLASYFKVINPIFMPSPISVLKKGLNLTSQGILLKDLFLTTKRIFISFFLSVVIGIPLGLVLGSFDKIYETCSVLIDFFRSIPGTALFPLFLLFFGLGDGAKIGNAVFASSLIILINSMYGVKNANKIRSEVAKVMRANRRTIFWKITLPDALPEIIGGLRIAVSICLIVIVVTEMFIGTKFGLGKRIMHAHEMFRISEMYVMIIITGILGYFLNQFLLFLEKRYIYWAGR